MRVRTAVQAGVGGGLVAQLGVGGVELDHPQELDVPQGGRVHVGGQGNGVWGLHERGAGRGDPDDTRPVTPQKSGLASGARCGAEALSVEDDLGSETRPRGPPPDDDGNGEAGRCGAE